MIVIDTSVWIEFLKQNPLYASTVNELLENREVLAFVYSSQPGDDYAPEKDNEPTD